MKVHETERLTRKRQQRILKLRDLYVGGMTLAEIGGLQLPPVTAQWIGELLRRGVTDELFERPKRGSGQAITDDAVRELMRRTRSRLRCSQILKIDPKSLDARFGTVIDGVLAEFRRERLEKRRFDILLEYRRLAEQCGYNPTSTDLAGTALLARIHRAFGSFTNFVTENTIRPHRQRTMGK